MTEEEIKEALEHREVLNNLKELLNTSMGRSFVKYLYKALDVGEMPELGLKGDFLMERLGFLRCGNSIFKLVSEADPKISAELLAELEKERQDAKYRDYTAT